MVFPHMNDVVGLRRYSVRQVRTQTKEPDPTSDSLALIALTPMRDPFLA